MVIGSSFYRVSFTCSCVDQEFIEPVMDARRSDCQEVGLVPAEWVEGDFTEFNDLVRIRKRS